LAQAQGTEPIPVSGDAARDAGDDDMAIYDLVDVLGSEDPDVMLRFMALPMPSRIACSPISGLLFRQWRMLCSPLVA
jgi:hypothetical protein